VIDNNITYIFFFKNIRDCHVSLYNIYNFNFQKRKFVKTLVSYKFKKIIKNTLKSIAKSNQPHPQILFIKIIFYIIVFLITIDQTQFFLFLQFYPLILGCIENYIL